MDPSNEIKTTESYHREVVVNEMKMGLPIIIESQYLVMGPFNSLVKIYH